MSATAAESESIAADQLRVADPLRLLGEALGLGDGDGEGLRAPRRWPGRPAAGAGGRSGRGRTGPGRGPSAPAARRPRAPPRASPEASASVASKSSSASAAPSSSTTSSVATLSPPKATSWSRVPRASRKLPEAEREISATAPSSTSIPSAVGDPAHDLGDLLERGALEVEALAAIDDRRHHLLRLGGGEDEDRVRRRLLERLQEGVPGLLGQHVGLVEDVDLPAPGRRARSRPARAARGRRPPSGSRRRPSRSRRARCRRRSSGRARTRRRAPGSAR